MTIASSGGTPMRAIRMAASTLVSEICAPIDRSMPPEIMTKAMPTALMAVNDTWRSKMMKLLGVAKFGAMTEKSRSSPSSTSRVTYFLRNAKALPERSVAKVVSAFICRTLTQCFPDARSRI